MAQVFKRGRCCSLSRSARSQRPTFWRRCSIHRWAVKGIKVNTDTFAASVFGRAVQTARQFRTDSACERG